MNRRTAGKVLIWRHAVALAIECWTLAEIGYYYTHDGETLHHAVIGQFHKLNEYRRHRASIRHTLDMIHDLPEREIT